MSLEISTKYLIQDFVNQLNVNIKTARIQDSGNF